MNKVGDLSDEELLARLREKVGKGHVWHAQLIAYLSEVEDRRLDRLHACSSIWDFCIGKLGMSESEAHRRITAARIIRRFPHVLGCIERGEIHICGLYALRKFVKSECFDELLREACGKTTREVEQMVASRFPKPDVAPRVEPVEPQAPLPVATASTEQAWSLSLSDSSPIESRAKVEPLSSTRYRIELTVSAETRANLERIKDLMRHRNPTGDLETIFDASLGLLLARLEKERLGKTSRPRSGTTSGPRNGMPSHPRQGMSGEVCSESVRAESDSAQTAGTNPSDDHGRLVASTTAHAEVSARRRDQSAHDANAQGRGEPARSRKTTRPGYISREVRREVFARDGEQCTYRDASGHRCHARGYLELDHIHARALGGGDTAENLRVRCRAHNALYAEQVFGRAHVEHRVYLQRRKCTPPVPPALETAARALRLMGFAETEVRRALPVVATKLDAETASLETIIREALLVLT